MLSVKTSVQISLTVPLPGPLTCSGFPRGDQEPAWIHSGGCSSLCQVCARFTATRRMVPIAPLHPILCWLTCITSTEFQTKMAEIKDPEPAADTPALSTSPTFLLKNPRTPQYSNLAGLTTRQHSSESNKTALLPGSCAREHEPPSISNTSHTGPPSPAAAPRARRGCRRLSIQSCTSPARGTSRPKSAATAPPLPAVSKPDFSTMPAYNSGVWCLPAGGLTGPSHSTEQRSGRRAARGSKGSQHFSSSSRHWAELQPPPELSTHLLPPLALPKALQQLCVLHGTVSKLQIAPSTFYFMGKSVSQNVLSTAKVPLNGTSDTGPDFPLFVLCNVHRLLLSGHRGARASSGAPAAS
ncbi:hypothetical protein Anapl_11075 [Anas platyrhynchos]|uniref:Uncharacterized protein n=1 Tax=Anas platyrhynchos TaxID=8839 RepID=R0JY28_ANAPL|nr:hypothetical protein Anapl_11075 [Anas platyrhynchos]